MIGNKVSVPIHRFSNVLFKRPSLNGQCLSLPGSLLQFRTTGYILDFKLFLTLTAIEMSGKKLRLCGRQRT